MSSQLTRQLPRKVTTCGTRRASSHHADASILESSHVAASEQHRRPSGISAQRIGVFGVVHQHHRNVVSGERLLHLRQQSFGGRLSPHAAHIVLCTQCRNSRIWRKLATNGSPGVACTEFVHQHSQPLRPNQR